MMRMDLMIRDGFLVWEEEWSGSECLVMEGGRWSNERDLWWIGFVVDSFVFVFCFYGVVLRVLVVGLVFGFNFEIDRICYWDVIGGC